MTPSFSQINTRTTWILDDVKIVNDGGMLRLSLPLFSSPSTPDLDEEALWFLPHISMVAIARVIIVIIAAPGEGNDRRAWAEASWVPR